MPTTQIDIEGIRQKIAVVNSQVAKINNDRSVNIGKKQTLEGQLANSLKLYAQKYGVTLSQENLTAELDAEINNVVNEKATEYNKVSSALEYINNKDYASANKVLGIPDATEVAQETVAKPAVADVVPPVAKPAEPVAKPAEPVAKPAEPVVVPPVAAPVEAPSFVAPPLQTITSPQPAVSTPVERVTPPSPVAPPPMFEAPKSTGVTPPPASPKNDISGIEFMTGVSEKGAEPMQAFEGFSRGISGLDMGVTPPAAQPSAPSQGAAKGQSFGDLLGNTSFKN